MSVVVPSETGNVADLVEAAAAHSPVHVALIDGSATTGSGVQLASVTWAELDAAVNAEVARLRAAGLRRGDVVVQLLPTSIEFAIALFATLRAGATAVPVSPSTPAPEVERLLDDSGARVLVRTSPAGEEPEGGALALLGPPSRAPSAGGDSEPGSDGGGEGSVGGGEETAVLAYTAGPIGKPRGAMLSHRALLANIEQCAALRPAPIAERDRVLLGVPAFHMYGLGPGLLQVVAAGASAVLLERFDVHAVLRLCREHRVTVIIGVPGIYQAVTELSADEITEGLSTVRLMLSGAAPLAPSVLQELQRVTGLGVYEGYGLTEAGPVLTSTLASGTAKPGSVGRTVPGVQVRLTDSDGFSLDDDDEDAGTGRVAARGPNLFSGYWPDGGHGPDAEGWFQTGDVGYLDADGDLHLVDRADDLIIVNGFNVYPHEVELVLGEVEEVREVAVVGVPDERSGERVKAVVVPAAGTRSDAEALRAHCAGWLPRYKVPDVIEFADDLPHSATGKLRRVALRGAGVDTLGPWSSGR